MITTTVVGLLVDTARVVTVIGLLLAGTTTTLAIADTAVAAVAVVHHHLPALVDLRLMITLLLAAVTRMTDTVLPHLVETTLDARLTTLLSLMQTVEAEVVVTTVLPRRRRGLEVRQVVVAMTAAMNVGPTGDYLHLLDMISCHAKTQRLHI